MPWGGVKEWAAEKAAPCASCGCFLLKREEKICGFFFLTPSATVLKMHAIKVTTEKDERKKELVTSYCLLPHPRNAAALISSCSAVVLHYAFL